MDFVDLQRRLVDELRWRVNNGEVTERGLAKMVGVSQPHIHRVLKGKKILSLNFCDRVLSRLSLSVLDLVEELDEERWRVRSWAACGSVILDILEGRIGPDQPWPHRIVGQASFAIRPADVAAFRYPVAAQLAADARMEGVVAADEWVVLDQAAEVRWQPVAGGLYLLEQDGHGLLRWVEPAPGGVLIIAEDVRATREAWEHVTLPLVELPRLVRARVHRIAPEQQWKALQQRATPPARRPPRGTRRVPAPLSVAS